MTRPMTETTTKPRRLGRSMVAVLAGFLAIVVLTLLTDQLFHSLEVYPPWGEPMFGTGENVLALSYRIVYTILGGFLSAQLAPSRPVGHAVALGVVGVVLGAVGAVAAWTMSPAWFLIALVLIALPGAWYGGTLYESRTVR